MATDFKQWPWALNQPGFDYPAEYLRAQHFDATSGGNGVSSPTALRVEAQPAPDGTVRITPGGATVRSTYAGAENQSYHIAVFQPVTVDVPPTGSASGGRQDLVVLRLADPQYGYFPPGVPQRELTADEAAGIDFWWIDVLQDTASTANLNFPHVKLAAIIRDPNETVVRGEWIRDLRKLANPKTDRTKISELVGERTEISRTGNYGTLREFLVDVPEWATHAVMDVGIGGAYLKGGPGAGSFGVTGFGSGSGNEATPWDVDASSDTFHRIPYIQAGRKVNISPARRGTLQSVYVTARVAPSSTSGTIFGADAAARAFLDIEWLQDTE